MVSGTSADGGAAPLAGVAGAGWGCWRGLRHRAGAAVPRPRSRRAWALRQEARELGASTAGAGAAVSAGWVGGCSVLVVVKLLSGGAAGARPSSLS